MTPFKSKTYRINSSTSFATVFARIPYDNMEGLTVYMDNNLDVVAGLRIRGEDGVSCATNDENNQPLAALGIGSSRRHVYRGVGGYMLIFAGAGATSGECVMTVLFPGPEQAVSR